MNVKGEELALSEATWAECLETAISAGWIPIGTSPPPSAVSANAPASEWNGSYSEILGQEVTRRDARNFGESLKKVCRRGVGPFDAVINMAGRGGFLLLPDSDSRELSSGTQGSQQAIAKARERSKAPFVPK